MRKILFCITLLLQIYLICTEIVTEGNGYVRKLLNSYTSRSCNLFESLYSKGDIEKLRELMKTSLRGSINAAYPDKDIHDRLYDSLMSGELEHLSCIEMEYIMELLSNGLFSIKKQMKAPKIEEFITVNDISTLFQDYILRKRPFKHLTTNQLDAVDAIPAILSNNYLWRIDNSSFDSLKWENFDILSAWPKRIAVNSSQDDPHICPLQLHQIVWNTGSKDIPLEALQKRIIDSKFLSKVVEKPLQIPLYMNRIIGEINMDVMRSRDVVLRPNEYLFLPNNYFLKFNSEKQNSQENDVERLFRVCYLDASNTQEFVESLTPHTLVSRYLESVIDSLYTRTNLRLIKSLSNEISLSTLTNRTSLQQTIINLLETSISGTDNESRETTNRRRRGKSNNWKDWQDSKKLDGLITSLTIPRPSSPNVHNIGRRNITLSWKSTFLPDSNDQTAFGFNITVCDVRSMPQSYRILEKYLSYGIEDDSSSDGCMTYTAYRKRQSDQRDTLLTLELIEEVDELGRDLHSSQQTNPLGGRGSDLHHFSSFYTTIPNLSPSSSYRASITIFLDSYSSISSEYSYIATTQSISVPSNIPCLGTIFGNGEYNSCIHAKLSDSNPLNSCELYFLPPLDDGGSDILGYHIYYQLLYNPIGKGLPTQGSGIWRYLGHALSSQLESINQQIKSIKINHLFANTSYMFKLYPFNSLGNSSRASISNILETKSTSYQSGGKIVLSSIDFYLNKNVHANSRGQLRKFYEEIGKSMRYIILDDMEETITIATLPSKNVLKEYPVWSAHWSPRSFIVEGLCVKSNPWLLNLSSYDELDPDRFHHKIVLIGRGEVSILSKVLLAQYGGAVAVIIMDDGSCDEYDQRCIPGSTKSYGEGFARLDSSIEWHNVKIPLVLLLKEYGDELLQLRACESSIDSTNDTELVRYDVFAEEL